MKEDYPKIVSSMNEKTLGANANHEQKNILTVNEDYLQIVVLFCLQIFS